MLRNNKVFATLTQQNITLQGPILKSRLTSSENDVVVVGNVARTCQHQEFSKCSQNILFILFSLCYCAVLSKKMCLKVV